MALLIAASIFMCIAGGITLFGYRRYVRAGRLYENIKAAAATEAPTTSLGAPAFYTVTQFVEAIGKKLPPSPANTRRYRDELIAAGYRSLTAASFYAGLKILLAVAFAALAALLQFKTRLNLAGQIAYVGIAAFGGFRLPDFVLARRLKRRRRNLRQALPDALDLMVVCAEAGLALERTLRVVGRELELVHPELSDELNLATLEVNAGKRRREALENLAVRTGEPAIRKFVTVLVQADRFGTEISEALSNHSEYMRARRRIDAEERAGKVSVKMVFPIFLFILPCILLVTVGPAALQIWNNVLPAIRG
jgi:tight adherence protein C